MKSLSILMFSWEFPPRKVGGITPHVYGLSKALVELGNEVHVITCDFPGAKDREIVEGVRVYRTRSYDINTPDFVTWAMEMNYYMQKEAVKILGKENIDILHAHDWMVAPAAISCKHGFRKPLIVTIHSTEYGRRRGIHSEYQNSIHQTEWWITYEAWRVICCSSSMKEEVCSVLGVSWDKVYVIPNGVERDKIGVRKECPMEIRNKFASPNEKIVLYVGRLVPEKGANVLIGAIPKVLSVMPNVKFVIVGDGFMRDELHKIAWNLGVYDKCYFTGYVDDPTLEALYSCADVATFPSIYEPFGIVALEAMSRGTPVVVSDTGGLREIVEHDFNGVKVEVDNSDSLAWGILHVLKNPSHARKLVENSRKKLRETYNWINIAKKTEKVYMEVYDEYSMGDWKIKV
ncbi:MAG: glycosyltransferase family 4 protein [Candidatus Hydrothermarchaeota archaeon]